MWVSTNGVDSVRVVLNCAHELRSQSQAKVLEPICRRIRGDYDAWSLDMMNQVGPLSADAQGDSLGIDVLVVPNELTLDA